MEPTKQKIKVCLVSSSGGHLYSVIGLRSWWQQYDRFWVVRNDEMTRSVLQNEKMHIGFFPENRHGINFLKNLWLSFQILRREKPTIVFSAGAGIAVPFLLMAKLLGIKTIFMEAFITIPQATLSGRILYPFVDHFIVQHKNLMRVFPKAYDGGVLE